MTEREQFEVEWCRIGWGDENAKEQCFMFWQAARATPADQPAAIVRHLETAFVDGKPAAAFLLDSTLLDGTLLYTRATPADHSTRARGAALPAHEIAYALHVASDRRISIVKSHAVINAALGERATPADQKRIAALEADIRENDALIDSLREQLATRAMPADHSDEAIYQVLDAKLNVFVDETKDCFDTYPDCMRRIVYAQPPQNAADHIEAQSVRDAWISVDERLPEEDQTVLATNGKWIGVAQYMRDEYLEDIERWQDEHREFIEHLGPAVTHWRALPDFPAPPQKPVSEV